ncbi:MAG: regulatory protein RecX [Acidobacteriaceae bacterium]|nr:regulatory protein RecX [Acidobacteriaceae bacterium]MBV8570279.1 regulatory protein RecX [Acidobacteriaceae bacterium]
MATRKSKTLNAEALWEYALRILAARPYSEAELRQKLARRSETPAALTETIARLREYGFADDRKFSEVFAASRLQNKGFGASRVLRDLRGKRVSAAVAEQAVSNAFAGTDERELANAFLERKYRGKNLREFLREQKNLASAYRRLRTAGFSSSTALFVLKQHAVEIEIDEIPEEE